MRKISLEGGRGTCARIVTALLLALLTACGGDERVPTDGDRDAHTHGDSGGDVSDAADAGDDRASDAPDVPDTPSGILCRSCRTSADCSAPENVCINLPSGESVCGVDCVGRPEICPDGYFCSPVGSESVQQCVPEALYCQNQCGDPPLECDVEGEVCDPLTGRCAPPLGLCDECSIDEQCGPGNLCLTFPDVDLSRRCGRACNTDAPCPDGYLCGAVDATGTNRQCVPEILTCVDRCSDVSCRSGQACNPLNGECEDPLGYCDPCQTSAQCGGPLDLCLTLLDGEAYCTVDCSIDPSVCEPGSICAPLQGGASQCVPRELTCVDRCVDPVPVECPVGSNCDPVDGTCHIATLQLCGEPCENNYECGAQGDLCLGIEGSLGGAFCSRACDPETAPCPLGYACSLLTDGITWQCAPNDFEAVCSRCSAVECPDGQACRPTDGECYALPAPCEDNTDCPDGELCAEYFRSFDPERIERRCEPVGLDCTWETRFDDCSGFSDCSATSLGQEGTCLQNCFADPNGCPDTAPACANFDGVFQVCVERGLGRPERCGRLMDFIRAVGEPCPFSDTDDFCPTTAAFCLEDAVDGIPGICTIANCTSDADCGEGAFCSRLGTGVTSYCIPSECTCMARADLDAGELDVLGLALAGADVTRCDLGSVWGERLAAGAHVANDPFRVELAGLVRNDGLYGADVAARQRAALGPAPTLAAAIALGAENLGHAPGFVVIPDFSEVSFCDALSNLWTGDAAPPACDTWAADEAAIPADIRSDVAVAIASIAWAATQRLAALPDAIEAADFDALLDAAAALAAGDATPADLSDFRALLLDYDYATLYVAARELATQLEALALAPERGADETYSLEVDLETPSGRIVLRGDEDHTYCEAAAGCPSGGVVLGDNVLLVVDLGGNDTYRSRAGATRGFAESVSVVLDLGGDDTYDAPTDAAAQGAGLGGIGLLFDRGQGDDTYDADTMSQGFGLLGVGGLFDDGSTTADALTAEALAQGAAYFGVGVALLGDGPTSYEAVHLAQGAAGPLGCGLLVDTSGDDTYVATPGGPGSADYAAPVVPERGNWSASQGAGRGYPSARPAEGGSLSGGVGVLVDLAGADEYTAGIQAQGAGYWHGLGILVEAGGDDTYEVHGYALGSGFDFGAGVVAEQGGADVYDSPASADRNLLGAGINFGLGLFIDEAGADTYRAGSQSIGVGFLNGFGYFIENSGNDVYAPTSEETMGKATLSVLGSEPATNPRREARTVGVFVDADGEDTYPPRDVPGFGNDGAWEQTTTVSLGDERFFEIGVGADQLGGSGVTSLPGGGSE